VKIKVTTGQRVECIWAATAMSYLNFFLLANIYFAKKKHK